MKYLMTNYHLCQEKSAFMFHHSFYPKPKIHLEDAKISEGTQHKITNIETRL